MYFVNICFFFGWIYLLLHNSNHLALEESLHVRNPEESTTNKYKAITTTTISNVVVVVVISISFIVVIVIVVDGSCYGIKNYGKRKLFCFISFRICKCVETVGLTRFWEPTLNSFLNLGINAQDVVNCFAGFRAPFYEMTRITGIIRVVAAAGTAVFFTVRIILSIYTNFTICTTCTFCVVWALKNW